MKRSRAARQQDGREKKVLDPEQGGMPVMAQIGAQQRHHGIAAAVGMQDFGRCRRQFGIRRIHADAASVLLLAEKRSLEKTFSVTGFEERSDRAAAHKPVRMD